LRRICDMIKYRRNITGVLGPLKFMHRNLLLIAGSGLLADEEDIELRIEKYGVNVIPRKPPPSFLQLAWAAFMDPLLIILTVAGFITIGLSFYKPPSDDMAGKNYIPEVHCNVREKQRHLLQYVSK